MLAGRCSSLRSQSYALKPQFATIFSIFALHDLFLMTVANRAQLAIFAREYGSPPIGAKGGLCDHPRPQV
jgi:hypothetical protein